MQLQTIPNDHSLVTFVAPQAPAMDLHAASDYTKPIKTGLLLLGIALGGFGAWSSLASLDAAVAAHGALAVESKRKTVQHLEGGIVKQILVKDGDRVRAGQPVIALDGTRSQAALTAAQALFDAARAREARLTAERDGKEGVSFPEDLSLRATDPRVDDLLLSERRQFDERRKSLQGQKQILEQRIAQLKAQHSGLGAQEGAKQRQIRTLRDEIAGLRQLADKGYYARNRVTAMERELAALEGEKGSAAFGGIGIEKSISEARMQIIQTEQDFRKEVVAELKTTTDNLAELEQKLAHAQDQVQRLAVAAPVDGVVQNVKIFTSGGVIPPGADLMEIVPEADRLVVEARVAPKDIEAVMAGLQAEIRFPNLSSRTTPIVLGTVTTVSADALVDRDAKENYYQMRVEVPTAEMAKLRAHRLQAGMPVEVMVKTGERTPLEYFVKPLMDSFAVAMRER